MDSGVPLGLALRTPTYLNTLVCIEGLLRYGYISIETEQNGRRVLIKGHPSCYQINEKLN